MNFSIHGAARRFRPLIALLALSVSGVISAPAPALAAVPTLSINDVTITEGDAGTTTMTFQVTQNIRGKTSVSFATAPGTASSPSDFISRSGKLKFAGGKKKATVAITIVGDTLDEANEQFTVRLSNPVGASITDGVGEGTITDNDAPPSVSTAATASVSEGEPGDTPFASIDVTLSAASGRTVSVEYTTVDGSATTAGNDYSATSGTLSFAAGQTSKSVVVQVLGDDAAEGDETFDLDLANPTNATLGTHPTVVTIQDNDPIPLGAAILNVTGMTVREGSGGTRTLTFTVTRSGETTTAVDVDYLTVNGNAVAPSDYGSVTGNVAFAANVTTATVQVQVVTDRKLEVRERFFLGLINPSAGAVVEHGQATGQIRDDDTWTRFSVRKVSGQIRVKGLVSPAHPNKHVNVTLYRRGAGGVWVRIRAKQATLIGRFDANGDHFSDSRFATAFARPRAGTCRVIARFGGDADHGPSQAAKIFPC